ncbi:MAG: chemotaxis protein CheX [Spirochaetia bacterium]|nr:chemotaxis protein CheX [Spirochaetia bacterium]
MRFDLSPFIQAMNHTFREMADVELINGPEEDYKERLIRADVSAFISLRSEQNVSVILTVPDHAARFLTETIGGKAAAADEGRVTDTIGELLNMLVGYAQKKASFKFTFSIPISIIGKNHEVNLVLTDGQQATCRRVVSRLSGDPVGLYLANSPVKPLDH